MNTTIIKPYASDPLRYSRARAIAVDIFGAARDALARLFDVLAEWQGRSIERRRLMELDTRLLRDAGLTHADAAAEHAKPFWRA